MTNGTSQGLFTIIAVIIFGLFVGLSYILFQDKLQTGLSTVFTESIDKTYKIVKEEPNGENEKPVVGYDKNVKIFEGVKANQIISNGFGGQVFSKDSHIKSTTVSNNLMVINVDANIVGGSSILYLGEIFNIGLTIPEDYLDMEKEFKYKEKGNDDEYQKYMDLYYEEEEDYSKKQELLNKAYSYYPVNNFYDQIMKYFGYPTSENTLDTQSIRISKFDELILDGVSTDLSETNINIPYGTEKVKVKASIKGQSGVIFKLELNINYNKI